MITRYHTRCISRIRVPGAGGGDHQRPELAVEFGRQVQTVRPTLIGPRAALVGVGVGLGGVGVEVGIIVGAGVAIVAVVIAAALPIAIVVPVVAVVYIVVAVVKQVV